MQTADKLQAPPERTRHALCTALVVNVVLFATVFLLWTPRFGTNDDVAMMLQAAGVSSDSQPTAYLLWTHVAIGGVLKGLYELAPRVPWYALYLVASLLAAHTAVLWVMLSRMRRPTALVLYLLCFLVVVAHLLLNLQFTTVAGLTSGAGAVLMLGGAGRGAGRRAGVSVGVAAVALVALGAMIRWLSFAMATLVFLPVLAVRLWRCRGQERLRLVLTLAAALAASGLLREVDRLARGRDAGWSHFLQYDPLLCRFVDDNVLEGKSEEALRAVVEKVGWSPNDYRMFYRYWFLDQSVFHIDRLRALLKDMPAVKRDLPASRALQTSAGILKMPWAWHSLAVAVLALMWLRAGPGAWAESAVAALTVAALVLYLVYARKPPPPRVYLAMFAMAAWAGLAQSAGTAWEGRRATRIRRIALLCAGTLLLVAARWSLASYRWQTRENRADQIALQSALNRLAPSPDQLYVVWGSAFPWPHLPPFAGLDQLRRFRTFSLGSAELMPGPQRVLREFGLRDLHLALANEKNVFLVCDTREAFPLYRTYMLERYGVEVAADTVFESEAFTVSKVRRAGSGRPAAGG